MTTDSLPFHVLVPRAIKDVQIQGKVQRGLAPVVWLRAEGAKDADMMTLVYSTYLDNLDWKKISSGGVTLWQREKNESTETITEGTGKNQKTSTKTWQRDVKQYSSIQEFYDNPPDLGTVGSVGIDRLALANLTNVDQGTEGVSLNRVLRGSHKFYVYNRGGDVQIFFDKIDRNRKKDADVVTVRIARADQLTDRNPRWLKTLRVKDDGNTGAVGPQGKPEHVNVVLKGTAAGAYFVEILTSEDVLLANLGSNSSMISFSGRVFLAEGPANGEKSFRPLNVLTNGSILGLTAAHDQGKQDIQVAGKKYSLKTVGDEVKTTALQGITAFEITRPDIKISSDGLLTFAPAKIFPSAGTHPIDLSTSPDLTKIDYVIATYLPTKKDVIMFDETYHWAQLDLHEKELSFALESPGMEVAGTSVGLTELTARLTRNPLSWNQVWNKLKGIF